MDTTQTTTHVSLCAGYGGIDLGLKRAIPNLRTVAFSEIEGFAVANLVAKMEAGELDAAPVWTDLKTFPWAEFRDRVYILSGGYPCQPFSAAGKRLGKEDPRHLWPWIADGIRAMRPRSCFFENVEGHISLGLRDVVEELASIGYQTTWGIFSAAEVGAPHQRKRVFILAHLHLTGLEGLRASVDEFSLPKDGSGQSGQIRVRSSHSWPSRPGQPQHGWEPPRVVGDTESQRSAARGAEHEGLGWELRAASTSGQRVVGDTDCRRQSPNVVAGGCSKEVGRGQGDLEPTDLGRKLRAASASGQGVVGDTRDSRLDGFPERHEETSEERSTNEESNRNRELQNGPQGPSRIKSMADRDELGLPHATDEQRDIGPEDRTFIGARVAESRRGEAQPALGGDSHGPASGLDYAELCITCDNRTDELRLLGNGVVPATAELAFRTLLKQLISET